MPFAWETAFIIFLQNNLPHFFTGIAVLTTYFGEEAFIVLIMAIIYWSLDKDLGRKLALNILTGVCLNTMLKNIFLRPRPYMSDHNIKCLKPVSKNGDVYDPNFQGHSFPSGHSTNAVTLYYSLKKYINRRFINIIAFFLPLLVGLSRIYLGVHYPSDVLFGYLLGFLVIFLLDTARGFIKDIRLLYLSVIILSAVGLLFCKTSDYYSSLGLLLGFCAGDLFERKYLSFEMPRNTISIIIRPLFGIILFVLLKLIFNYAFSSLFIASESIVINIFGGIKYFISVYLITGVYPAVFKPLKI